MDRLEPEDLFLERMKRLEEQKLKNKQHERLMELRRKAYNYNNAGSATANGGGNEWKTRRGRISFFKRAVIQLAINGWSRFSTLTDY